jgi:2-oxoglutarate ferredoxin oxidoreductase subunit delta
MSSRAVISEYAPGMWFPERKERQAMATKQKQGFIRIDSELCKGCYLCESVCPLGLISVSDKLNQKGYYPAYYREQDMEIEEHQCKGCALCAVVCPDIAIEVYRV